MLLFAADHCAKATHIFEKRSTKIQGNQTRLGILDLSQEKLKESDALVCGGHLKKVTWFFQSIHEKPKKPNKFCHS
jgi:hypothetical protein